MPASGPGARRSRASGRGLRGLFMTGSGWRAVAGRIAGARRSATVPGPVLQAAVLALVAFAPCPSLSQTIDTVSPTVESAQTDAAGENVIVTFSEDIFVNPLVLYVQEYYEVFPIGDFIRSVMDVRVDGRTDVVFGAAISGNELTLQVSTPAVRSGQTVEVAYDNVFAQNSQGLLVDAAGNPVPFFAFRPVTNNSTLSDTVADVVPPVLSLLSKTVAEGSSFTYTVELAAQPDQDVSVIVAGAPPLVVYPQPAGLAFTPDNWDTPQTVTVSAAADNDSIDAWALVANKFAHVEGDRFAGVVRVLVEDADTPLAIVDSADPMTVSPFLAAQYTENRTAPVATYAVAGATGTIQWSLLGPDKDRFTIGASGELSFSAVPDYENPADENADNVYAVTLHADSGASTGVAFLTVAVADETVEAFPSIVANGVRVTSTPAHAGNYVIGESLALEVTFDTAVTVNTDGGVPYVELYIGGSVRQAPYVSTGSSGTVLHFSREVELADSDTDGFGFVENGLTLNGGTIRDAEGRNAVLDHSGRFSLNNHMVNQPAYIVEDGVTVGSSPVAGDSYATGESIDVEVTFNMPVVVSTTTERLPYLEVSIGSNRRVAEYASTDPSSTTLTLSYTVVDDDHDQNGIVIPAGSVRRGFIDNGNGAGPGFTDRFAERTFDRVPDQGTLTGHKVNKAPSVVGAPAIASTPMTGDSYSSGETIGVEVTFDLPVTLDESGGTPSLRLDIGGDTREAPYASTDGTGTVLTFAYEVVDDDHDQDGVSIGADALSLNGATVGNAAGHDAILTHAALADQGAHKVNKAPRVVGAPAIASTPQADDRYSSGETIRVELTFDAPVTVDETGGTPSLRLDIGGDTREAPYASTDGTGTVLTFAYEVADADHDQDGVSIGADALSLNGATVRNAAGRDAIPTHPGLADQAAHRVNAAPTAVGAPAIASAPGTGDSYSTGETIRVELTFDASVTVDESGGTPSLSLDIGGAAREAVYDSTDATGRVLSFLYEVASDDNDQDGISIAADSVEVNGGTIQDAAGRNALLDHAALGAQSGHKVNRRAAIDRALSITSAPQSRGSYAAGETIEVAVRFDVPVTVDETDGTPSLRLDIGGEAREAVYVATDGTGTVLTFAYEVVDDDFDPNGVSIAADSLALNGGAIVDAGGADALLGHAALGNRAQHKVNKPAQIVSGGSGSRPCLKPPRTPTASAKPLKSGSPSTIAYGWTPPAARPGSRSAFSRPPRRRSETRHTSGVRARTNCCSPTSCSTATATATGWC